VEETKSITAQTRKPTREDVLKCFARFDEIDALHGGLPDNKVDGHYLAFRNKLGFAQP
tara:strand:- start:118 stop:291 length:174 start_codon:yes stop_codon:yes gene_type:complete